MKLPFKQIEPFVKNPDAKARVILIYGPESGLMKERSGIIGKSVVADLNDPFNAVTLSADKLIEDPARLMDEAMAMSMLGGARLIRIEDAGDTLSPLLKEYLQNPSAQNLVIVEAGELGTKSPLRAMIEKADNAAALPCYVEDERDLTGIIRETLKENGLSIDQDALGLLASALVGDRLRARNELDKLIIYKGAEKTSVTLDDVQECVGGAGAQTLDKFVYSVTGSKPDIALSSFQLLAQEGVPLIVILRSLQSHFRRLHVVKARVERGESIEIVMKSLQPPVFWKQEDMFKSQIRSWSLHGLARTLQKISELEANCKKTGVPDETLTAQALLSISRRAA
jgi:DNA polymerase-3 subunit delta